MVRLSTIARDLSPDARQLGPATRFRARLQEARRRWSRSARWPGGVAHDFNNVLAVILGNLAHRAHRDLAEAHDAAPLALAQQATAARARALVQQISPSAAGCRSSARRRLAPLVEEAVAMLRHALPASATTLHAQLDIEPPAGGGG